MQAHSQVRVFHLEGQRFELRPWHEPPGDDAPELQRVSAPAECRFVLARLVDEPSGRAALRAQLGDLDAWAPRVERVDALVEHLLEELERGRQVLWRATPRPAFTLRLDADDEPVDLVELGELDPGEERAEDEGPLHVMVRIHYDPQRPEAWDDRLRLFTTEDDGGTYDQTVDLASDAQTEREDRNMVVLFRDVVPDQDYSCFLDLGPTEGGYLVFHRHRLGRMHHVTGLPRDGG